MNASALARFECNGIEASTCCILIACADACPVDRYSAWRPAVSESYLLVFDGQDERRIEIIGQPA